MEVETTDKPKAKRFGRKTLRILVLIVLIVLVGGFIYWRSLGDSYIKKPDYPTIIPVNTSIKNLGGWQRVSPPGDNPVFAYTDKIDGVEVSVSQQPLPQTFKSDPVGQTAELAKKFNATTKIDAGDVKVYVGTSIKGPQSAIFTKYNLLILIKSQKKISDTSWANYAESLK